MNLQRALAVLVLLAVGLAQAAAPSALLTEEQMKQVREAERLFAQMLQEQKAGNLAAAEATCRKVLGVLERVFGGDSDDVAAVLQWLSGLCEAQGKWKEAIAARERRAGVMARLLGRGHWRAIDARLEAADTRLRVGLTLAQRKSWQRAAVLGQRAAQLSQQGRAKEAIPLGKEVLEIYKNVLGEKHPDYAKCLGDLASLYEAMGESRRALSLCQQALRLKKGVLGEKHPNYATNLNNLALLYKDLGDYKAALPLYQQALAIFKEALGEKHPNYATNLNNLALLYQTMGDHKVALPLLQKALAIRKEVLGEKHPDYAISLNNLAVLYLDMGEHRQALPLYRRALRLTKELRGEKHPDYATSLNNLAGLYLEMGDYRQALPLAQRALQLRKDLLGEKHPDYAISLNTLASLYQAMGEHRQALPFLEQALRLAKDVLGEKHPSYAKYLNNLASLYKDMGEHRQALPLYHKALRLTKELRGEKHPHYAKYLGGLALLHLEVGEHRQALPLAQQALRLHKEVLGEKHPDYAISLHNLASLYQDMGKGGTPPVLYGQALAVVRAHVQDSLSVLSDRQRQQLLDKHARSLEFFLSTVVGLVPAPALFEHAAGFKDIVSISIAEQRLARQNPALRPALEELQIVRAELAHHSGKMPAARELARWRKRFDELDQRKTDLEQQLAQTSTDIAQLRQKPTAAYVAARLPERTALVEFLAYWHERFQSGRWRSERRLLAFVVRSDRECVLLEPGNADRIFGAVRLWRQSLADGSSSGVETSAGLLQRHLWRPIARHLDGIDTILIAPDGDLASLPFAALPGDKRGTFLVEQYAFGYLSSGRQLLMPLSTIKGDGLLVLGGAHFGKPHPDTDPLQLSRSWSELPGAALEAQQVKDAFAARFADARRSLLSGRGADRAGLLAALDPSRSGKHWRYLHLATHGHFDPPRYALPPAVLGAWSIGAAAAPGLAGRIGGLTATLVAQEPGVLNRERGFDPTGHRYRVQEGNPMLLCRLVLAGVNDVGQEGYLSAEEIALLNLDGCELAVLSACETSAGRQAGWQGVQGLQRGFHQAGARHVLASLWNVNDPATSVLMEEFYRLLWSKKATPLQALRQAQLFVLRNPNKVVARARDLEKRLADSKLSEAVLLKRGIRVNSRKAFIKPGKQEQSPIAWWAPWVLSGAPTADR